MDMNQYFTGCFLILPLEFYQQSVEGFEMEQVQNWPTLPYQQELTKVEPPLHNCSTFWELFKEELSILNDKIDKKIWTQEEDELLIELRENGLGWRDISRNIAGTKDQICKRRYHRLLFENSKWSKEIDNKLKILREKENRSWKAIFNILRKEYGIFDRKKLEELKIRYLLHLRSDICKEPWELHEDFKLINFVKENGKKWRKLSQIFGDRTELQLKNRYYGTLLPIQTRILKRMEKESYLSF